MSRMNRIEEAYRREDLPEFDIGDTVDVHVLIKEGDKERIQVFNGVVIRRRGGGLSATYTVRRIVGGQGVERTFPMHSRMVQKVVVKQSGKTRRAKLYFLRDRRGKATRLREVITRKPKAKPKPKPAPKPPAPPREPVPAPVEAAEPEPETTRVAED